MEILIHSPSPGLYFIAITTPMKEERSRRGSEGRTKALFVNFDGKRMSTFPYGQTLFGVPVPTDRNGDRRGSG